MGIRKTIAAIVLATAAVVTPLAATSGAGASVHPNIVNHQYCFASASGCVRIQNDGGNGSDIVVGATDINGTAEDVSFEPISGGSYNGNPTGLLHFTGHTNEYMAADSSLTQAITGPNGSTGDVWAMGTRNGAIVLINRAVSQAHGNQNAFLQFNSTAAGSLAFIGTSTGGFQRLENCSGSC